MTPRKSYPDYLRLLVPEYHARPNQTIPTSFDIVAKNGKDKWYNVLDILGANSSSADIWLDATPF
jgi:hypothetical protein